MAREKVLSPGQPVKPMEPVPWPTAFDGADWVFQPKWDGVRLQAHVEGGDVYLFSKRGQERTVRYPELVTALPDAVRSQRVILDGEVVVFHEGRPNFPRVMRREMATRPGVVRSLMTSHPVTYMVFDILYFDNGATIELELVARQRLLQQVLVARESVLITPGFPARGLALFEAVRERGWEGMVAKLTGSTYLPGVKSPSWRKIKIRRELLCTAGGYTLSDRGLGALLLGAYQDERLLYVGRAGSGLTEQDRSMLLTYLSRTVIECPPFVLAPHLPGMEVCWVDPSLVVRVEFSEWTADLRLRHPVVRGFTTGDVRQCQLP